MIPPETLNGYLDGGTHIVVELFGQAESFLEIGDPVCRYMQESFGLKSKWQCV